MSFHETMVRLRHMLDYSREAVRFAGEKRREDLDHDRLLNLALVRLLEIVGEAAGKIPTEDRARYADVPWNAIVGLRNRLIHGYDSVDFDILWHIVTDDLPGLIATLESIVSEDRR